MTGLIHIIQDYSGPPVLITPTKADVFKLPGLPPLNCKIYFCPYSLPRFASRANHFMSGTVGQIEGDIRSLLLRILVLALVFAVLAVAVAAAVWLLGPASPRRTVARWWHSRLMWITPTRKEH